MDPEGATCYENQEPSKVTETQNVYSPLEVNRQELIYDSLNNKRVAKKPGQFCDLSKIWKWMSLSFGIIAVCLFITVVCLGIFVQQFNKTCEDRMPEIKERSDKSAVKELDQGKDFTCDIVNCANGGTCYNCSGGFRCVCSAGFTGITCQEKTHCFSSPCEYPDYCVEARDSYKCVPSPRRYYRREKCDDNDKYYNYRCKRRGWFEDYFRSTCTWISDYRANWTTAVTECQRQTSHLVQIFSLEDIEILQSRVKSFNESVWVGGSLIGGQYTWQNEAIYVHRQSELWTKCEPNGDVCMRLLYQDGSFLLDDDKCEEEYIFVCQFRM